MNPTTATHITPEHLETVAVSFGIGTPTRVRHLPDGLMNDNWKISTSAGRFALKRLRDVPAATARRNLHVVTAIAAAGVPTSTPVLTAEGDPILLVDSHAYCLLPWITGTHVTGSNLTLSQAEGLGRAVGRLHQVLNAEDGPLPAAGRVRSTPASPQRAADEADRFEKAAYDGGTAFDQQVIELLRQRRQAIDKHADLRPVDDDPAGPHGWSHGDLQHRNLLWTGTGLAAILDWDRIRVRPLAEEVARTTTILFGAETGELDLDRTAAFIRGYRSALRIGGDDLADGFDRLWWKRLTDFWHLVFHYDRGDTSCDHLFAVNETFLHWWTCHRQQVRDAARTSG